MIHDRNLLPEEDVDELILIALRLCLRTRLKGEAYWLAIFLLPRFCPIAIWKDPLFPIKVIL